MTYVGRDHRGRIVFHDAGNAVGTVAEEPLLLPQQSPAPATAPAIDPDQAWADIHAAIWAFTEHWIAVSRNTAPSTDNDRVMKQFLAEWGPLLAAQRHLQGTVEQRGATVLAFGRALQQLVQRAHELGIPDPPLDLERDRSWLYLTPDTKFAQAR